MVESHASNTLGVMPGLDPDIHEAMQPSTTLRLIGVDGHHGLPGQAGNDGE
jgi:hypothetical protein